MRIRYFADIRFPLERANGVQTMETCHALARRGHRVHLVVRPDRFIPGRDPFSYYGLPPIESLRIEQVRVPSGPAARRLAYLAHALRRTAAGGASAVLTRDLGLAALLLLLPARWRPPLVYESHGFAPAVSAEMPALHAGAPAAGPLKRRRLDARERRVWRLADGYVAITAGLVCELERRYGPRTRVAVVPDGARLPEPPGGRESEARGETRRPVVGYAGHLYPWKGTDVLMAALGRLAGMRGLIVGGLEGEGDLARVRALAEQSAPGRVEFTGMVEPSRVAALLRRADVLVLPNLPSRMSETYTSPLKLFEYMASGRPIVASDLPALREVLRPDENAVLVAPGDADALAAGIRRVAGDPALASRLAAQARRDVAEYTWDRRAERLDAVLTGAVEARA